MLLIRQASAGDLDAMADLAGYLDSINLPADRDELRAIIDGSEESFSGRREVAERRFVFVLVDTVSGQIHGTSMIFARHGSMRAPHVFFDVLQDERYSETLDRHFNHPVLRIGYNYTGKTEIGGLNQWIHVWAYKDAAERFRIRDEARAAGAWPPNTRGQFVKQENMLVVPAEFSPLR